MNGGRISSSSHRLAVAILGARMHYAVPVAFEKSDGPAVCCVTATIADAPYTPLPQRNSWVTVRQMILASNHNDAVAI